MLTREQLDQLETAVLEHVVSEKGRKRDVIEFLLRKIRENQIRKTLPLKELLAGCPGDPTASDMEGALRRVVADVKKKLDEFFDGEGQSLPYRMTFKGKGNYLPMFVQNEVREYVRLFWKPYLDSEVNTRLLYPEPFFLTDRHATTFRNSAINKLEDKEHLAYLGDPQIRTKGRRYVDTLKPGYSYVPAGIVQAMFFITNKLLSHASHLELKAQPLMPGDTEPPPSEELILFATPTSVRYVVEYLEDGLSMRTTSKGVRVDNGKPLNDDEVLKRGVLTRRRHRDRTVTLISAQHGRTVEAIAQALTNNKQLADLAKELKTPNTFPQDFQALFLVQMKKSPKGPSIDSTVVTSASAIEGNGKKPR